MEISICRGKLILENENKGFINFVKTHSYDAFKLLINQVGIIVFSLAVSFTFVSKLEWYLISSIFCVLFHLMLVYTACWDMGEKEAPALSAGRMKPMPLKGLYVSLLSNIIKFLFVIFVFLGMLSNGGFFKQLYSVGVTVLRFLFVEFSGIMTFFFENGTYYSDNFVLDYPEYMYILMLLPTLIACTLGYYMGSRDKRLFAFIPVKRRKH